MSGLGYLLSINGVTARLRSQAQLSSRVSTSWCLWGIIVVRLHLTELSGALAVYQETPLSCFCTQGNSWGQRTRGHSWEYSGAKRGH